MYNRREMSSEKYSPTDGIVQEDQAARVTVQRLCNLKKTWVEPEDGPPPFEVKFFAQNRGH